MTPAGGPPLAPGRPGRPSAPPDRGITASSDERVLRLCDATMFWNPSGGVRRYVTAKRDWLAQHGRWEHRVATPTPDEPGMLRIASLPLPGSGGAYRVAWRRGATARQLVDARPDLIESADPYRMAWSSLDAAARLGIPAVAFCHSNLPRMAALAAGQLLGSKAGALAERAARAYLVRLYRRFDLVLAPSRWMTAQLRDWGVDRARHQPLGVDTALFDPGRRHGDAWRRSLGLPRDARLLVYAGRFAPEKQLPLLADAVRRLDRRHWLLAVGAGPRPPVGERVVVLPALRRSEDVASVLASGDLFVHAGGEETFGLSVLEAMACGLPVVGRASSGTGELIDDTVGAAVRDASPASFADAIEAVFERPREALVAAARRRALAHDWRNVLPGLGERYDRLAGRVKAELPEPA